MPLTLKSYSKLKDDLVGQTSRVAPAYHGNHHRDHQEGDGRAIRKPACRTQRLWGHIEELGISVR